MALGDLHKQLREKLLSVMTTPRARPFTCAGSPYECSIFIVGLNSATALGHPFFDRYWDDDAGFLRDMFEADYGALRSKRGVRPRIESIVSGAAPARCLETNIYAVPSKKASQLRAVDKDPSCFEILMQEIRPRAVFVHSNEPITYFASKVRSHEFVGSKPVRVDFQGVETWLLGWRGPLLSRGLEDAQVLGKLLRMHACAD